MKELTPAERQFWHEQAAREEIIREHHELYMKQAQRRRDIALSKLGMISLLRSEDEEELDQD